MEKENASGRCHLFQTVDKPHENGLFMVFFHFISSLNDRFPWAFSELTRAFSSSGFRRLRNPTGDGHLFLLTYEVNEKLN